MSEPKRVMFKNAVWKRRPMTIREDGWDGVSNIFNRLFHRQLNMVYTVESGPITLGPGESIEMMFPLPDELQP